MAVAAPVFSITSIRQSNSASPTIIGTGTYNGVNAVFKIFCSHACEGNDIIIRWLRALNYERDIYRYINIQTPEIKKYFVNYLGDIENTTLRQLHENHRLVIPLENEHILQARMAVLRINIDTIINIIITENTQAITIYDSIERLTNLVVPEYNNLRIILNNIFDLIISGIHILNNVLRIQHNDMHFKNIFINEREINYLTYRTVSIVPPNEQILSRFKISIFDYDRSFVGNPETNFGNNPLLDTEWHCLVGNSCNSISYKDYFIFIIECVDIYITYRLRPEYSNVAHYMSELLNALILDPAHRELVFQIVNNHLINNMHGYCFSRREDGTIIHTPGAGHNCHDTAAQDDFLREADGVNWLSRIPANFNAFTNLHIEHLVNPINGIHQYRYNKKYLKYKKKYLRLKKELKNQYK